MPSPREVEAALDRLYLDDAQLDDITTLRQHIADLRARLAAQDAVVAAARVWMEVDEHTRPDCTGEDGCPLCAVECDLVDALAALDATPIPGVK